MKKIMILGAGIYQVPLIKQAKKMGLHTIVVSYPGNFPGFKYADEIEYIDIRDQEKVLTAAKKHNINGITTTGSDVGISTIAYICDKLNLVGPSRESATIASSKSNFHNMQKGIGLQYPVNYIVSNEMELIHTLKDIKSERMVIKPNDSSGSKGITVIDKNSDNVCYIQAFRNAYRYSKQGIVSIENFIEGIEVGGDVFVFKGICKLFTCTYKHMSGTLIIGHSIPGSQSIDIHKEIIRQIELICVNINYLNGPINYDAIIYNNQVTILEIGLRNGGNGITDLVYYNMGVDLHLLNLLYVTSNLLDIPNRLTNIPVSSIVFGARNKDIIKYLPTLSELKIKIPNLLDICYAVSKNSTIYPFIDSSNLIGYAILSCKWDEYIDYAREFLGILSRKLKIELLEM